MGIVTDFLSDQSTWFWVVACCVFIVLAVFAVADEILSGDRVFETVTDEMVPRLLLKFALALAAATFWPIALAFVAIAGLISLAILLTVAVATLWMLAFGTSKSTSSASTIPGMPSYKRW